MEVLVEPQNPVKSGRLKSFCKCVFLVAGVIAASPLIALNWIECWLFAGKSERFYCGGTELLAFVPTFVGESMRLGYYRICCTKVSTYVRFMLGSMLTHRNVTIGSGSIIGRFTSIGYAEISENVQISAHVSVLSGKYQQGQPVERRDGKLGEKMYKTVHIGRNSWIGQNAVIMADVGENSVVGAGSVVYNNVKDNITVLGNPARKVSY